MTTELTAITETYVLYHGMALPRPTNRILTFHICIFTSVPLASGEPYPSPLFFFFHPINIQIMAWNERPIRHHFGENLSWHRVMVTWSFPTWQWKRTYGIRTKSVHIPPTYLIFVSLFNIHTIYIASAFYFLLTLCHGSVSVSALCCIIHLYNVSNGYFLSNRKITTHFELCKCLDPNIIRLGIKKFYTFHFMAVRILSRVWPLHIYLYNAFKFILYARTRSHI